MEEKDSQIQDAEIVAVTPASSAETEPKENPAEREAAAKEPPTEKSEPAAPKVIVKKERGVSYFVGFALLTLLAICFFFIPGITLVYLVSCVAAISAPVAWIFAAILSVIVWFIFKLKIKGFRNSFLWYIGT